MPWLPGLPEVRTHFPKLKVHRGFGHQGSKTHLPRSFVLQTRMLTRMQTLKLHVQARDMKDSRYIYRNEM